MAFNATILPRGELLFPTPTYFDETQFFGRDADVQRVRQLLDVGSSIAISGKRRIGRTWFLYHLRTVLPQDRYLVVASEELKPNAITPPQARLFLYALIYSLYTALHTHLSMDIPCKLLDLSNPPLNIGQALRSDIAALHQYLTTINLTAVILIDEAEALLEFKDEAGIVPAIVQSLTTNYSHIRVIVAGFNLRAPVENNPPLFNAFAHHQLYGIGSEGAYDLIAGQLSRYGVLFESTEAWVQVTHLTGEEPALLRLLGQQLIEQARRNNGLIGLLQIQEAVEDFFVMPQVGSWLSYAWNVLGVNRPIHNLITTLAYKSISDVVSQRELLDKVKMQFYSGHPPETIHDDVRCLCSLGFLYEHEPTGCLQFSSDLLRQWICRNRPNPQV